MLTPSPGRGATPPREWRELLGRVKDFTFPTWIRDEYPGEALVFAYLDWFKEGYEPWTTRTRSPVQERGARGVPDFPDVTVHALADCPLCDAPDVDGNEIVRDPDIGAYEIQS